MLGLRFCARAFSSCGKRGPLFITVRGPLTIAAPPVAGHRLQTRRLSSCGSRAQLLRGMWDLPRPGLEPVSPALAGRFSATAPPGKPLPVAFDTCLLLTPDIWLFLTQTSRMKVQKVLTRHIPFRLTLFANGSLHLGDPLASDSFLNSLHVLSRKCLFQFLLSRKTYLHKRYGLDLPNFY